VDVRSGQVIEGYARDSMVPQAADREGTGLLIEGKRDVTLRGVTVYGYRRNLVLRGCRNVVVEGGDFSHSHQPVLFSGEAYDERDWLDIFDESVWRAYGAGIVLEDCEDCRVTGVRANGAQNGVMLIDCRECAVSGCDLSRNTGWGVWMWKSHRNRVTRNNCDWCLRCEDPDRYSAGGDSAGIMLSNDNCDNVITYNTFRFSGDGFFLNGLRVAPSENNLIAFNDGSHSPHNAFESSFSGGNRFIGNIASNSRFGFWCGYSHHNELIGNVIENCLEWGIAIEHGQSNRILGNELRGNRKGVVLWRREAADVSEECPDRPSREYVIEGNVILAAEEAVLLSGTVGVRLLHNELRAAAALRLKRETKDVRVEGCDLLGEEAVAAGDDCQAILSGCYTGGRTAASATALSPAAAPHGSPRLPVLTQPVNPVEREDREFRWYDKRRAAGILVGAAEV
jgi:parallel beta-helix repeat protein